MLFLLYKGFSRITQTTLFPVLSSGKNVHMHTSCKFITYDRCPSPMFLEISLEALLSYIASSCIFHFTYVIFITEQLSGAFQNSRIKTWFKFNNAFKNVTPVTKNI